jgi:hypothetical protein
MVNVKRVASWGLMVALAWGSQADGASAQFNRFARSLRYNNGDVTSTPVSGRTGTPRALNTGTEPLPIAGVAFINSGNNTCIVKSRTRGPGVVSNYDFERSAPSCMSVTAGVVTRSVDAPAATFITGLEVCLPNTPDTTTGDRIAGVRIHLSRVEADGTVVSMNSSESAVTPDCANWQPRVDCPANSLAVNVLAQTNPQGVIRGGLALSCAPLVGPPLRAPLDGTNWGIDLTPRVVGAGFTGPERCHAAAHRVRRHRPVGGGRPWLGRQGLRGPIGGPHRHAGGEPRAGLGSTVRCCVRDCVPKRVSRWCGRSQVPSRATTR